VHTTANEMTIALNSRAMFCCLVSDMAQAVMIVAMDVFHANGDQRSGEWILNEWKKNEWKKKKKNQKTRF
jgi:hypothetical protein